MQILAYLVLKYGVLVLGLIIACWQDIRYRRISNSLTIVLMICGLILAFIEGLSALQDRFWAILLPFLLFLPLFALRILGAGDIKLLMAIGALMGKKWLLRCILFTILMGGIIALLLMIKRGILLSRLHYFFCYCRKTLLLRCFTPYQILNEEEKIVGKQFFPFALAIALGCIATFVADKFW